MADAKTENRNADVCTSTRHDFQRAGRRSTRARPHQGAPPRARRCVHEGLRRARSHARLPARLVGRVLRRARPGSRSRTTTCTQASSSSDPSRRASTWGTTSTAARLHHWKRKPKSAGDHQPLPRGADGALHLGDQAPASAARLGKPREQDRAHARKERPRALPLAAERERLLAACRASAWRRLYLLVLMAITTGARRGELVALTWGDINLERRVAHVQDSKNGEPRVLPLTPAAVDELARFQLERAERARLPRKTSETASRAQFEYRPGSPRSREPRRSRSSASTICATRSPPTSPRRARASSRSPRPSATASSSMVKRYAHLTVESKAKLEQPRHGPNEIK
jgi:integrase